MSDQFSFPGNMSTSAYDPLLGWVLASNMPGNGMSTLDHGIRRNGSETEIRQGGILAVGDSFTAGSEVVDAESWPAHLERMTGVPVINGAAGGYGADQIVLRIEQLMPIVKPSLIIVGLLDQDILRCQLASGGKPKPYFTVENGELVHHNNPVPIEHKGRFARAWDEIKAMVPSLGDHDGDYWLDWGRTEKVHNNPVEITCRLLRRLRNATDVPIMLVMQYGGFVVSQCDAIPMHAQAVLRYAHGIGIAPVDEFASLRAIYTADPAALDAYYVMHPPENGTKVYGHMSSVGNAHIAGLIAGRLQMERAA